MKFIHRPGNHEKKNPNTLPNYLYVKIKWHDFGHTRKGKCNIKNVINVIKICNIYSFHDSQNFIILTSKLFRMEIGFISCTILCFAGVAVSYVLNGKQLELK